MKSNYDLHFSIDKRIARGGNLNQIREVKKIIPVKNPNRKGLVFLVRTYVEPMVTF